MSNQDGSPPLEVNPTPMQDMVTTGLRLILTAGAAVTSALGYAGVAGKFNALCLAAGPVAAAFVFVWAQWASFRKARKLAYLTHHVSDDVAKFK